MLGSLYVDAFVCPGCSKVYFFEARNGIEKTVCSDCSLIISEDDPGARIVRDIELWQK